MAACIRLGLVSGPTAIPSAIRRAHFRWRVKPAGFINLWDSLVGPFGARNSQESQVNANAAPTFKVYGSGGLMQLGTSIATKSDSGASLDHEGLFHRMYSGCLTHATDGLGDGDTPRQQQQGPGKGH